MKILVVNSGSSSLKYKLFNMHTRTIVCEGLVERIGESISHLKHTINPKTDDQQTIKCNKNFSSHSQAILKVAQLLVDRKIGVIKDGSDLFAIGHRVAQGGETFTQNCLVDNDNYAGIMDNVPLAPLHNPANLSGIKAAMELFPGVPSIAVFDTLFSRNLPPYAFRYAIPEEFYTRHRVRRYGFHGTSHEYVSKELARLMGRPGKDINHIVCHLGNGSSMTAVRGGVCIDTSMGMTPMAGLIMGTRCGDIDPSIHAFLAEHTGKTLEEIDDLFNRESGLKGICGMNDMRDIHNAIARDDEKAKLAFDMLCYGLKKYIGAYHAVLGRIDSIVFTAGIGENDEFVRAGCLDGLEPMGIVLDPEANAGPGRGARRISADNSRVQVWVIPTNEELAIADACLDLLGSEDSLAEDGP